MKCVFKDAAVLKKIIAALSKDLTLTNFVFTTDGLTVNAMNNSHTDMRELVLKKNFFAEYECGEPETVGINIDILKKFVNTAKPRDTVSWATSQTNIVINVQEPDENKSCTEWTMKLVDFDQETLNIPDDIQWDCHVRIGSALFRQWISKTKLLEGNFTIKVIKDQEIVVSVNSDLADVKIAQKIPSVMAHTVSCSDTFIMSDKCIGSKEVDALDFLIQCSGGVDICFESDMPLVCTSYLDTESYIRLWIAPMLGEEE
jgi:proliferating cell nuclear antigen PCNA